MNTTNNILDRIAAKTRERISKEMRQVPLSEIRRQAERILQDSQKALSAPFSSGANGSGASDLPDPHNFSPRSGSFRRALARPGISFICEVKKASPSKGVIAEHFPYLDIAREYEAAGAAAISCLTEPHWFLGSDQYLRKIASQVSIPVLRKDFTISPYMIYQAKAYGASAILLICSILDDAELHDYLQLANELHLDVLTEAHSAEEIERAVKAGAQIIGVNNRNLKTFEVDVENSRRLRALAPRDAIFVSESGIRTAKDIRALYENGTDAVLIGETLMRADDKRAMLKELSRLLPKESREEKKHEQD